MQMPVLYGVLVADVMLSERRRILFVVVAATGETQSFFSNEKGEILDFCFTWHKQIFHCLTKRLRTLRHQNHHFVLQLEITWKVCLGVVGVRACPPSLGIDVETSGANHSHRCAGQGVQG